MKNLIFFNYFHNGDIHASREFVKDIMNKIDHLNSFYYHPNENILNDINIKENKLIGNTYNNSVLFYEDKENYYINTWFHLNHGHKLYQCTIESLQYNFKIIYDHLKIQMNQDLSFYIPFIDYSKFNINNVNEFFLKSEFRKYIFISNGKVNSGQSDNLSLDDPIRILSNKYKDCLFILSNNSNVKSENIILSKDIIKSSGVGDLNENSYITTKCDVIVGRESGPFFFSYVKDNVTSDKEQYIVPMCHIKPFLNVKYYNKNKKQLWQPNSKKMVEVLSGIL